MEPGGKNVEKKKKGTLKRTSMKVDEEQTQDYVSTVLYRRPQPELQLFLLNCTEALQEN